MTSDVNQVVGEPVVCLDCNGAGRRHYQSDPWNTSGVRTCGGCDGNGLIPWEHWLKMKALMDADVHRTGDL